MKTGIFSRGMITPIRFQFIKEKTSSPITDLMNGFTTEVSLDGVKITAWMSDTEVETLLLQYVLISLSFQLPGTSDAIAATATIANFLRCAMMSKAAMITFGVLFVDIDYSDKDLIGEFILQRIKSPTLKKMHHIQDKKIFDARREAQIPCMAQANFSIYNGQEG